MSKQRPMRAFEGREAHVRSLYLVDIENMVGSSELTQSEVAVTQRRIEAAVQYKDGDHTVIAASHHNAKAMLFGWSGAVNRKIRSGENGADLALLESVSDIQWIAQRYGRVVVASGDNAFAFLLASLKTAGVEVLVVRPDTGFAAVLGRVAGPHVVALGPAIPTNNINLFTHTKDVA